MATPTIMAGWQLCLLPHSRGSAWGARTLPLGPRGGRRVGVAGGQHLMVWGPRSGPGWTGWTRTGTSCSSVPVRPCRRVRASVCVASGEDVGHQTEERYVGASLAPEGKDSHASARLPSRLIPGRGHSRWNDPGHTAGICAPRTESPGHRAAPPTPLPTATVSGDSGELSPGPWSLRVQFRGSGNQAPRAVCLPEVPEHQGDAFCLSTPEPARGQTSTSFPAQPQD